MLTWTPPGPVSWISRIGGDAERTLRNVRLGLVALNALVVATCCVMLWTLWLADVHMTESRATNAVRLTEQSATAILDKAAIVLEVAGQQTERHWREGQLDANQIAPVTAAHATQMPPQLRIAVFDRRGTHVCPTLAAPCKVFTIADRDHFVRLSQHPDDPIKLYGPYISRNEAQPIVLLARALRTPSGAFAGVITSIIPLTTLQTLVSTPNLGPNGSMAIRGANLAMVARQPPVPLPADLTANPLISPELREAIASQPDQGLFRANAPIDGVDRVIAYKRLARYPLYIQAGIAAKDFLAEWHIQVGWTLGFLALFAAASWQVAHATAGSLRRQAMAQKLYHEAPCGYHTLDEQGYYLSINATELKWLGCTESEVIRTLRPTDFFTDEGKATFAKCFPQLKQTGHLDGLELDLVGRHGQVRRVQVNAKATVDERTGFWMSNSVMHDITALHQTRLQLQALAKEQGVMLDTDLIGMVKVHNRHITWANHGAERIFGYTGPEWHQMPTRRLYPDQASFDRVGQESFAALDAGQAYRTQLQLVRKDGQPVWIDVNAVYLSAAQRDMMLVLADITPIKMMEEARVRSVELDALNAQLKETSRLQNEFLSNMSHELRTPLNAIIGFSHLLAAGNIKPDSARYASYLKQIGASGEHLLRLINTMLDYTLAEAGKMSFSPTPVQLQRALQDILDVVRPQSEQKGLQLALDVSADMPAVLADPMRLKQMLLSLLDNAIKFSSPGGCITVCAQMVDDDFWSLQVKDQGIGIDQADLPKLFTPFIQLSSGTTKSHGGIGLGLTLLRRLVLAQGGKIDVSSQLGRGATFTLILPRRLSEKGHLLQP
ncbi:MAG: ATP-binding protein [Acidobacteriota bacterium]